VLLLVRALDRPDQIGSPSNAANRVVAGSPWWRELNQYAGSPGRSRMGSLR
jgi:hypothetical protein